MDEYKADLDDVYDAVMCLKPMLQEIIVLLTQIALPVLVDKKTIVIELMEDTE